MCKYYFLFIEDSIFR